MVGEYRRMSMMSSSLVLSRGGIGNSNSSVVEMGNNEHHQSYYTAVADPDESGRHRSKSYKGGGGGGGGNKNGKVHLNNVSSSGQRDVLKPKSRTAASSSTSLVTRQNQEWLYRIGVALLVAVASQCLKCH